MAWPLLIAGGVAAAGAIINGVIQANSAAAAAKTQESAAQQAMSLQRQQYQQQRDDQQPWLDAGRSSLASLMRKMNAGEFDTRVDPSQIANDPGYQFRMAEGQKALERSAAARGMLGSGGTLKSLSRYSQGLASDEYQNAWARNQSENSGRFGRLASMAGVGQNAAQSLGAMGGQYAGSMSSLYGSLGDARSAGQIGRGNAIGGAIQGVADAGAGVAGSMYTTGLKAMGAGMGGGANVIPTQAPSYYPGAPSAAGVGMGRGYGFGLNGLKYGGE